MSTDRFGNAYAPGLPYARGRILTSTEDDFRKLQQAWRYMAARLQGRARRRCLTSRGWSTGCR